MISTALLGILSAIALYCHALGFPLSETLESNWAVGIEVALFLWAIGSFILYRPFKRHEELESENLRLRSEKKSLAILTNEKDFLRSLATQEEEGFSQDCLIHLFNDGTRTVDDIKVEIVSLTEADGSPIAKPGSSLCLPVELPTKDFEAIPYINAGQTLPLVFLRLARSVEMLGHWHAQGSLGDSGSSLGFRVGKGFKIHFCITARDMEPIETVKTFVFEGEEALAFKLLDTAVPQASRT